MKEQPSGKTVSESAIHDQTSVVYPNDLNAYGTLFGGRVLELCDKIAGVVAKRHSGKVCVTLSVDSVRFLAPAKHGDILVFKASLNRTWHSSMEIGLKVFAEDFRNLEQKHIVSAYFTFVAVDDKMKPVNVIPVIPESDDEKRRYTEADKRRQLRLATFPKKASK
ncbi:MAG: acyl-CoA thioesterase [Verrucomicrobia bacterium]|nr:acyl-CoA thioesterase [Verrucomicrobiota bacterium]